MCVVVTDLETLKNVDVNYAKPLDHLMLRWSNTCLTQCFEKSVNLLQPAIFQPSANCWERTSAYCWDSLRPTGESQVTR